MALALAGCAEMRPTMAPHGRAHWANVRRDVVHRRIFATAVNPSPVPVVIDCSDMRRVLPAGMEADVLIFGDCDLTPRLTYGSP